jgi:O-antigen ligase
MQLDFVELKSRRLHPALTQQLANFSKFPRQPIFASIAHIDALYERAVRFPTGLPKMFSGPALRAAPIMASVTVEASAPLAEPPAREDESPPQPKARIEARIATALLALMPGALVVYFSFNSGGFFPSSVGFIALLVTQMLVLRILVVDRPFAGYTRRLALVAGVFAVYTGWIFASQLWSDAPDRAFIEFDRALLYLGLLVLFGLLPRPRWRMPWILRGLALGIMVVCTCALISRVLPHVWPTRADLANDRLSFPLTYWNALGILAAVGIVLTFGITANPSERRWVRALAAAAVPIAATTLFFTFSRGAILAVAIGLVAYIVIARSSTLFSALLTIVPATIIAIAVAYNANLLATTNPTSAAAVEQGKKVALAVLGCVIFAAVARLATLWIDRRLEGRRRRRPTRRQKLGTLAAVATVLVVLAFAAGAPGWVSDQYDRFISGAATQTQDLRGRLIDPSNNGRTEHWRVAVEAFSKNVFTGQGAGTYEFSWARYRHETFSVVDGHGLYFEVLSEYGIPGLLLLVATLAMILLVLRRSARGPNRMVYATLFAAVLMWVFHAGIDWDWEMPAATAWVFAVGGAALAARPSARKVEGMGDRGRIPIAAALLVVAVTPTLLMLSQYRLQTAANAFEKKNCKRASSEALASIRFLSNRPQPYQILGYCDLKDGRVQDAVTAMKKAVGAEPASWEYHLSLAIAQGYAGIDPRPEAAVALEQNPREVLVLQAVTGLQGNSKVGWLRGAQELEASVLVSNRLTLR